MTANLLLILVNADGAAAQNSRFAYVTSESAGTISGIDTSSNQVGWQADVRGRPHNLEVTRDGLLVIATQGIEAVSVIDAASVSSDVKRIAIGAPPHDVTLAPDGRTVFVVSERGLLLRLDPATGRILQRVELNGQPHDLAREGQTVWITDVSARRLFVFDGEKVRELSISVQGHDIATRPNSRELWVTPWNSNRTVIVDPESNREIAALEIGRTASHKHVAFTTDGSQAWITEPESESLFVVDAQRRQVIERVALGGHPHHIRLSEGKAYLAVDPEELVTIDAATRKIVARTIVGSGVHDVGLRPVSSN